MSDELKAKLTELRSSWNTDRRRVLVQILLEMLEDKEDGRLGPVYKVDALRHSDQEGDETYTDKEFFINYVVAESKPKKPFKQDTDRKKRFLKNIEEITEDMQDEDNMMDLFEADGERDEWTPKLRKNAPEGLKPIPTSKDEVTQEGESYVHISKASQFERRLHYSDIAWTRKIMNIKYRVNEHRDETVETPAT